MPATAGREFRVGDLLWRNIGSDRSDLEPRQDRLEALSGGGSYGPATYTRSDRDDGPLVVSREYDGSTERWPERWYRPEDAEERMAAAEVEDEDEGALLDLPHEPVGDPSAPEEDLDLPDDLPTVDIPEDATPPTPTEARSDELLCDVIEDDNALMPAGARTLDIPGVQERTTGSPGET